MSEERWLSVVGYEGRYEVSNLGRVRSLDRTYMRAHPNSPTGFQTMRQRGCLRQLARARAGGYLVVTLYGEAGGKTYHVHRLVMNAFVGPRPAGMEVRHLDGNPQNALLDNLAYGTPSENRHDRRAHGTDPMANKTHCPSGHRYDEENTYSPPSRPTARYCRACSHKRRR